MQYREFTCSKVLKDIHANTPSTAEDTGDDSEAVELEASAKNRETMRKRSTNTQRCKKTKTIVWSNHQKSKLIKALLNELTHICEETKLGIIEIVEMYHLRPEPESFSTKELFALSQHNEDENELARNQNHIVQCVQDHQTKLSRNEAHIEQLDKQLKE